MMKSCASSVRGRLNQMKSIEKGKIQKNIAKKIKKIKNQKSKREKKKSLFSVVLDKMCVFCLYHIPDSQQCVKRGSYRRPILSGLLFFSVSLTFVGFWACLC